MQLMATNQKVGSSNLSGRTTLHWVLKWAHVTDFEMLLDGKKIAEYRATTRIYFDIER
jgi:flavin-binding protein dodecin